MHIPADICVLKWEWMGLTVATILFSHKPVQEIIAALVLKVKMWDRKYKYTQPNVMRYQFIGLARFRQAHKITLYESQNV